MSHSGIGREMNQLNVFENVGTRVEFQEYIVWSGNEAPRVQTYLLQQRLKFAIQTTE